MIFLIENEIQVESPSPPKSAYSSSSTSTDPHHHHHSDQHQHHSEHLHHNQHVSHVISGTGKVCCMISRLKQSEGLLSLLCRVRTQ